MKRGTQGVLETFTGELAKFTSDHVDPLGKSTPTCGGAFVAINHKAELGYVCAPYLYGNIMAHLRGEDCPSVDEYCVHKGAQSTARRTQLEEESMWDPVSGTYCVIKALNEGLEMYHRFTLKRAEQRDIFVYSPTKKALVGVNLDEFLRVLKAQRRVAQNCTKTQMCNMLMVPFKAVFLDGRAALRDGMSKIKCAEIDWATRLAPLKNTQKARTERKALIKKEEDAAQVARKAALREAVAAKHKSSGTKRKAPEPKVDAAKKQKMTNATTVTPRVTRASASAREEALVSTDVAQDSGVEDDEAILDALGAPGADWEAMYAARANALALEESGLSGFEDVQGDEAIFDARDGATDEQWDAYYKSQAQAKSSAVERGGGGRSDRMGETEDEEEDFPYAHVSDERARAEYAFLSMDDCGAAPAVHEHDDEMWKSFLKQSLLSA